MLAQIRVEMLQAIKKMVEIPKKYMAKAKDKATLLDFWALDTGFIKLRSTTPIIKVAADEVLNDLGVEDPILDIAKGLEKEALADPYFVRKLYPNVDFTLE